MNPGGIFISEFGDGQAKSLIKIAKENSFEEVEIFKDLSGRERFLKIG